MYVPDPGDAGAIVAAYTAQFGNGVSASIAIEQSRRASVVFVGPGAGGTNSYVFGSQPNSNSLGGVTPGAVSGLPDVVGNLRIDQAWGSILAGLALHDSSGGYYGVSQSTGHPSNNWGWAATVGGIFNLPFIAPGDRFAFGFVYSEGAVRYAALNHPTTGMLSIKGGTIAFGWAEDAVYAGPAGAVQNTTAWSLAAGFEHLWTPALRTSLYGSYFSVSHNATAIAGICANVSNATISGVTNTIPPAGIAWGGAGCNPNWNSYVIGTRTQWEPVKGWIMGVDVLYLKLHSATTASGVVTLTGANAAIGAVNSGQALAITDQSAWVFTFRTQRDYHP